MTNPDSHPAVQDAQPGFGEKSLDAARSRTGASLMPSRRFRWSLGLSVAILAISGLAQLPLFRRYHIADVPGLAWTDDFFITSLLHYLAASVFLLLTGYALGRWFTHWRGSHALTANGALRATLYTLLALTGLVRAAGNSAAISLDQPAAMAVALTHLAATMLLGVAWLMAAAGGGRAWLRPRPSRQT